MLRVKKSDIIIPSPGQYSDLKKNAIREAKTTDKRIFILRADDRLEMYFGTEATKQGFAKITYDPCYKRKRPGIPQWEFEQNV